MTFDKTYENFHILWILGLRPAACPPNVNNPPPNVNDAPPNVDSAPPSVNSAPLNVKSAPSHSQTFRPSSGAGFVRYLYLFVSVFKILVIFQIV